MTPSRIDDAPSLLAEFARATLANAQDLQTKVVEAEAKALYLESRVRSLENGNSNGKNGNGRVMSEWMRWALPIVAAGLLAWGTAQTKQALTDYRVDELTKQKAALEERVLHLEERVQELSGAKR